MSWIRLDPQELGSAGGQLRDISVSLTDAASRLRAACCSPGLGQHAGTLMAEGEALSARTLAVTEGYLRLAVDVIQRAIVAVRDSELVSAVSDVGSISAAVVGGTTVGGGTIGWTSGVAAPTFGTVGGSGPAVLTIVGGGTSSAGLAGLTTATVGGSWSSTSTDSGVSSDVIDATRALGPGQGSARTHPRIGMSESAFIANLGIAPISARAMDDIRINMNMASTIGTPTTSQVNAMATVRNLTYTPDYGQRR